MVQFPKKKKVSFNKKQEPQVSSPSISPQVSPTPHSTTVQNEKNVKHSSQASKHFSTDTLMTKQASFSTKSISGQASNNIPKCQPPILLFLVPINIIP